MSESDSPQQSKPSSLWGAAKIAAAMAVPIPGISGLLRATDSDVREAERAYGWGGFKAAEEAGGANPAADAMARVNMAGAAIDALTGSEGEDSYGRKIGRAFRGELQRTEENNPEMVGAGQATVGALTAMVPGAPVTAGAQRISAALGARGFGRVAQGAASGAAIGGAQGLYDTTLDNASKQMLDSGVVDYGKAAASGLEGGGISAILGGVLGGGGAAVASGVEKYGSKVGQFLRSKGANQFMRESGMLPSEIESVNKDHSAQIVDAIDSALGDAGKSKDGPTKVIMSKAEEAAGRVKDSVGNVRNRFETLAANEAENAEAAVAVAERNTYAKGAALQDEVAAELGEKKAGLYDALGRSEAAVDSAVERRMAAQTAYEQARDAAIAQKSAELEAARAIDPAAELRAAMRDEYRSAKRALAEEIESAAGTPRADKLRAKQAGLMDEFESKYESGIAKAESARAKLLSELESHVQNPDQLVDRGIKSELASAEKGLSHAYDAHGANAKRLSDLSSRLEDQASRRLSRAMAQLQAQHEKEVGAFRAQAEKRGQALLDDLRYLDDPKKGFDAFEKKYGPSPSLTDARLAAKEQAMYERLADARKADSVPLTDLGLLDKIVSLKRRVAGGGALGSIGAVLGGVKGGLVGTAADIALKRAFPHYAPRLMYGAGGLSQAAAATLSTDAAARSAVASLFSARLPSMAAAVVGTLSSQGDPSDAATTHAQRVANMAGNPELLSQRVEAAIRGLPHDGQGPASAKVATVVANIQKRAPQAIIQPSAFGGKPVFSNTDINNYEDYSAAAMDPAVALKAMRARALTPAMADAINENWPELVDTMRDQFLNSAGAANGKEPDTQAIRQYEILTGEALLPENRPDNVAFIQRFWDQDNRTNQQGSQGGGSAGSSKAMTQSSKTPSDSMSLSR